MIDSGSQHAATVAVLGGGLAGLSLALQIRQALPDADLLVLERNRFPAPEAAFKVGESTVELATHYFAAVLGLKEHLDREQLPKLGLRFFFGANGNERIEERLEVGARAFPPSSSYQLDRGRFENFLADHCASAGVRIIDGAKVRSVDLGDKQHRVRFSRNGRDEQIGARWVVDASGRAAVLKRQLGLQEESPHKSNAAWFRIDRAIDVQQWSAAPDWLEFTEDSRWFSTNHLMGAGYWVWLIPLSSGATSIGIVADERLHPLSSFNSPKKALAWLARHEPQAARKIGEAGGEMLDFLALKHYSHGCRQVFSAKRWCLTGEAGVFLDPFYSPGSDFIAMSNSFICDLIGRDLDGKPIGTQAAFFNDLYLSFYRNTALIFQDQYPLFGHPQIMPLKIVWDFATYWTFMAYLFFQDALCSLPDFMAVRSELDRIGALNTVMQRFFLRWHEAQPPAQTRGRIDLFSVEYLYELNCGLQERAEGEELHRRIAQNVERLEELAIEIIARAAEDHPELRDEALLGNAAAGEQRSRLKRFLGGIGL